MKIIRYLTLTLGLSLSACAFSAEPEGTITIEQKWSSSQGFETPESVLYDPGREIFYVSNINGSPAAHDGNGFISTLDLNGKVKESPWITGLDAPKGMALFENRLYVSDIDRVVQIDVEHDSIALEYTVPGASFLNDIAVDSTGLVYISDTQTNRIYRLKDGQVDIWMELEQTEPNGLCIENGRLLAGAGQSLLRIDPKNRQIEVLIAGVGSIDGLRPDGHGGYLISDWRGKTQVVAPEKKAKVLLDTSEDGINSADFEFVADRRLLVIPTFSDNRVVAYELSF